MPASSRGQKMMTTALWPWANEAAVTARQLVVIGNPASRRVRLLQTALPALRWPPARLASYAELFSGRLDLTQCVRPGDVVRIESPGKDFAVERLLLALGARAAESEPYARLPYQNVPELEFEKG